MSARLQKIYSWLESIIKGFNLAFFVVSTVLWIALTVISISTQSFSLDILWSSFNTLYGEISFKISCIFLIIFNGMRTLKGLFNEYAELKEKLEHTRTLKKMLLQKGLHKGLQNHIDKD